MVDGNIIDVPYIKNCPVNIECKVNSIIPLGSHDVFIAEVQCSHINENLIDENGKIHFEKARLISYSHGDYYPASKNALGHFGFSVAKTQKKKKTFKNKGKRKK
jgi:flavin reductase (DIM6/NTAB) family NADH-FMN oxidoreductase RutF